MRTTRVGLAATALCLLAATPTTASPGALDPAFGNGGVVLSSYCVYDAGYAIVAASGGKVVVAGTAAKGTSLTSPGMFVLARHLPNGRLDTSFGNRGVVRTVVDKRGGSQVLELLQYSDGKLLAIGRTKGGKVDGVVLARYLADGRLDKTFSDDGIAVATVRGYPVVVTGGGFLPDGAIVVVGTFSTGVDQAQPFVQRFLPDGRLDASFGQGGTLVPAIGSDPWVFPTDVAVLPDTSLVLTGWSWNEQAGDSPFVVRLLPTGDLDPVFGSSIPTDLPGGDLQTVERTADGMLLVGGARPRKAGDEVYAAVVLRLLPTGTLDPTFGTGGIAAVQGNVSRRIFDIVPISGARYVGVGASWEKRGHDTMLWRFDTLGAPDTAFGPGGVRIRSLSAASDIAWVGVAGTGDSITTAGAAFPKDLSRRDTLVARFLG